jgi:hypothetical protein
MKDLSFLLRVDENYQLLDKMSQLTMIPILGKFIHFTDARTTVWQTNICCIFMISFQETKKKGLSKDNVGS